MPPALLSTIKTVRIHPAIGVARVGNSPDEYFLGPETPEPPELPAGGYKDSSGRLKRQAARFRIYGYDENGEVVAELDSSNASIYWTVHVANKKSAWYDFEMALDIPEALSHSSTRRNAFIPLESRSALSIDPGPRSVSGVSCPPVAFDTGKFFNVPVYLGEIRTDDKGRLLYLGGLGKAGTPFPGFELKTFANNPGWYDDIADGPVTALVIIGGKSFEADPAWVISAPPNYAPNARVIQSIYDVICDAVSGVYFNPPAKPSFTKDILPILESFVSTQWVNEGFALEFGWQAPFEFTRKNFLSRLASPSEGDKPLRQHIFSHFRDPSFAVFQGLAWPPFYGDGLGTSVNGAPSPREGMSVTKTIYNYLSAWASGNFIADYDPNSVASPDLDTYPLEKQPEILDRGVLTFCSGGPFHPGCELTWPMRHSIMYRGLFRLRHLPPDLAEPDFGEAISQATINLSSGPLSATGPGGLTRWMAVPWHADTASCLQAYPVFDNRFPISSYLPTFWPARAPNAVLAEADYQIVIDSTQPLAVRQAAFRRRVDWLRLLGQNAVYLEQVNKMVEVFGQLGVVEPRPGPANDPEFPATMQVEITHGPPPAPLAPVRVSESLARARFRTLR